MTVQDEKVAPRIGWPIARNLPTTPIPYLAEFFISNLQLQIFWRCYVKPTRSK